MKKTISIVQKILIGLFIMNVYVSFAETHSRQDSIGKSCFYSAKVELENMLSGKIPMDYERAVFITENAYWGNNIDFNIYKQILDIHTNRILNLFMNNTEEKQQHFDFDIRYSGEEQQILYRKLLANWAIFTYLTDTTYKIIDSSVYCNTPFVYSFEDPLGTVNWKNTQVLNLLENKKGNCYALAAFYKIFSLRFNSDANLATAPGHIFITHNDMNGTPYNIEPATGTFPGSGSIKAYTNTTHAAVVNGISMRELDLKQSVALCLVYLAKGYEKKFNTRTDDFILHCAETTLKYDAFNLNAMLLKAEVLEERIISQNKSIQQLQNDEKFKECEKLIFSLYKLGYREMPVETKNLIIARLHSEKNAPIFIKNQTTNPFKNVNSNHQKVQYATLSWGRFDEVHETKSFEQYGQVVFDTKKFKICMFITTDTFFNQYDYDPVVFGWSVDPLTSNAPGWSPYNALWDNPILNIDPDGRWANPIIDKEGNLLGTDSKGWEGEAIVMDKSDFKQGMDHKEALKKGKELSKYGKGISVPEKTWNEIENNGGERMTPYVINNSSKTVYYKPEGEIQNPGYKNDGAYPITTNTDLYAPVDGVATHRYNNAIYKVVTGTHIEIELNGEVDQFSWDGKLNTYIKSMPALDGWIMYKGRYYKHGKPLIKGDALNDGTWEKLYEKAKITSGIKY